MNDFSGFLIIVGFVIAIFLIYIALMKIASRDGDNNE